MLFDIASITSYMEKCCLKYRHISLIQCNFQFLLPFLYGGLFLLWKINPHLQPGHSNYCFIYHLHCHSLRCIKHHPPCHIKRSVMTYSGVLDYCVRDRKFVSRTCPIYTTWNIGKKYSSMHNFTKSLLIKVSLAYKSKMWSLLLINCWNPLFAGRLSWF